MAAANVCTEPSATLPASLLADRSQIEDASAVPFSIYQTEHFTFFHTMDDARVLHLGNLLEEFRATFSQSLQSAGFTVGSPEKRLTWVCFGDRRAFNAYAAKTDNLPISLDGYYSARTNRVALYEPKKKGAFAGKGLASANLVPEHILLQNLDEKYLHEAAHQLSFSSGFLKRGVMYPLWISEGFATNFETIAEDSGGILRPNLGRQLCLSRAKDEDKLVPLKDFLGLTQISAAEDADARGIYSQAWSLFRFAFSYRSNDLKNYLTALAKSDPGWQNADNLERQFIDSFGPLDRFEREWLDSIRDPGTIQ